MLTPSPLTRVAALAVLLASLLLLGWLAWVFRGSAEVAHALAALLLAGAAVVQSVLPSLVARPEPPRGPVA